MELKEQILELAKQAKEASRKLSFASGEAKNKALYLLADLLKEKKQEIILANEKDIAKAQEMGLDAARVDRLKITDKTIASMARACIEVAGMSDPVGEIEEMKKRPNGLMVGRMRIPLGVVAIIYESRPNVTIDAAILCLKAGNAVILRGGSEAFHSNRVLAGLISQSLKEAGLPEDGVVLLPTTDREAVRIMLKLDEFIDVVIPRGGEGLIRAVVEEATMPVLKHYKGVCHIYVHKDADLAMALDIVFNAKVQRPGVCNALECLLVHRDIAAVFLPQVAEKLGAAGVQFHACAEAINYLKKMQFQLQKKIGDRSISL